MKNLNQFIIERLKLTKDSKLHTYNYFPKDFDELRSLIEQLLDERGKDANLNDIDVSKVKSFYNSNNDLGLFEDLNIYNIDISQWDVSNVENMSGAFYECNNFNCDLSKWNVSNVKDMYGMFDGCENFKGDGLEKWNPIKCKDIAGMFRWNAKFDCNLENWDVSNVKYMNGTFNGCENFKGDGLENWKPIKCENMYCMFNNCPSLKNKPNWYKE